MTFAYFSLLLACLLPYLFVGLAKFSGPVKDYDNEKPRIYLEGLMGWRKRAYWAHLNAFEAMLPFIAAIVVAHACHAPAFQRDILAALWLVFRLAHGFSYIKNYTKLRTLFFTAALLCVIFLFVISF